MVCQSAPADAILEPGRACTRPYAPEPELYEIRQDAAELRNRATDAPRRTETLAGNLEEKLKSAAGTPDAQRPQASMDREAMDNSDEPGFARI